MRVRFNSGGPVGLLILVGLGLFYLEKLPAEGPVPPRALLWTAALAWFAMGIRLRARAWRIVDTPTSKVVAAAVGASELAGTAIALRPVVARASGTNAVWYRWELLEHRGSGKNASWVTVDSWEERHPFMLEDDTGAIRVDPATAEFNGIARRTYPVPGRGSDWQQVEWVLPDRAPVYVFGPVRTDASGSALEVAGDGDGDAGFVISDDSEREVARRFGASAWAALCFGLVAAVMAPQLTLRPEHLEVETETVAALAVVAGGVYLGALAASWLLRAYNRLVIVKNQAEKAWASIEVQLQRRLDLIANLVAVVRGYVEYERSTQVALAATRAQGPLPDARELHAATSNDAAGHAEAQQLLALGEAYPVLHADAQFLRLGEALRDTENRIALSRTFYNDAVNVMRDRRGTFPYLLVAMLVPMPSLELFEATERDAVAVGL